MWNLLLCQHLEAVFQKGIKYPQLNKQIALEDKHLFMLNIDPRTFWSFVSLLCSLYRSVFWLNIKVVVSNILSLPGEMIQFHWYFFKMGGKNHQLDMCIISWVFFFPCLSPWICPLDSTKRPKKRLARKVFWLHCVGGLRLMDSEVVHCACDCLQIQAFVCTRMYVCMYVCMYVYIYMLTCMDIYTVYIYIMFFDHEEIDTMKMCTHFRNFQSQLILTLMPFLLLPFFSHIFWPDPYFP